jgi:hypothetical protein
MAVNGNTPTTKYSVLLRSLDQEIPLRDLEEASTLVPSVARADCLRIHRLLAGILIQGLAHQEALAFRNGLAARGHQVDVVEDARVPRLPSDYACQRVVCLEDRLCFSDAMGRDQFIGWDEMLFLAGAVVTRTQIGTELVQRLRGGGRYPFTYEVERRAIERVARAVRMDFFFGRPPYRLRMEAGEVARFFVNDRPVQLRDPHMVAWAFHYFRGRVPSASRLNNHIQCDTPENQCVPFAVYEEEIRWRFFRLREPG